MRNRYFTILIVVALVIGLGGCAGSKPTAPASQTLQTAIWSQGLTRISNIADPYLDKTYLSNLKATMDKDKGTVTFTIDIDPALGISKETGMYAGYVKVVQPNGTGMLCDSLRMRLEMFLLDKNGVILASTRTAKFGDLFKVVYDQSTLKQTMTIVSPVTFTGQFSTVVCDATAEVDVGFVTSE